MAPPRQHHYSVKTVWSGAAEGPARTYNNYSRDHVFEISGKPDLMGSADPAFLGDPGKHNPEDLLVASLSACHMLWFLHLATDNGIEVVAYTDVANGTMEMKSNGSGHFTNVTLKPVVIIEDASQTDMAVALHDKAHKMCFIAASMNFPVEHHPEIIAA